MAKPVSTPTLGSLERDSRVLFFEDARLKVARPDAEATAKWNLLFPLGETKYREDMPDGKLTFTRDWCATLVKNAKDVLAKGHRIQANYHHLGGFDLEVQAPLESTVASGWILDVELRADGPYALIDWTEKARGFIERDELGYLSPEFATSFKSRDTGKPQGPTLLGVALTNTPFLKSLPRVAASDSTPNKGKAMDKALICAALGLPADATDEQINAAAAEMSKLAGDKPPPAADEETKAKLSEATVKLAEKDAVVLKLAEENKTLGAENKSLGARVLSLEDAQKKGAADAYVAELVRAGKIAPAQHAGVKALALSDLALAKSIYDNAPVVVKLGESGVPGTTGPADEAKAAEAKLDARVAELRKADPALKFSEAHRLALSESPDLARIYAAKP